MILMFNLVLNVLIFLLSNCEKSKETRKKVNVGQQFYTEIAKNDCNFVGLNLLFCKIVDC